jgi:hypothetical protein
VRTAESAASNDPDRIAVLLAGAPGQKLKGRLLEVISRQGLVACGPAVIEEVRFPSPAHSQRACEILSRLLGAEPSGLSSQSAADRETAAQAWSALWAERGKGALAAARIRRSIAVITRTGPPERSGPSDGPRRIAALEALIQEGRPAVPLILEVLEGPGFPAHLLEALERISGQRLGLRPASWKTWWAVASAAAAGSPAGTKE